MRLRVFYATRYLYSAPVTDSHNEVRLMPHNNEEQTRTHFQIATQPPVPIFNYMLPTGRVHHFNLRSRHQELALTAESLVLTDRRTLFTDLDTLDLDSAFYRRETWRTATPSFWRRHRASRCCRRRTSWRSRRGRRRTGAAPGDFLRALMSAIHANFAYTPGATTVDTPLPEMVKARAGVCQDFTHLMLAVCRRQGIPSRYVSGYLFTGERAGADQTQRLSQAHQAPANAAD